MERNANVWWSGSLFRLVGYGLLLLTAFDLAGIFFPPHFADPVWEFQMVGRLVEGVGVPLLALTMIFYGEASLRELTILKILSWLTLVVGLLYLLLLPLGLSTTWRINTQNNREVSNQINQQLAQIQQRKEILNQASDRDLDAFFLSLKRQSRATGIKSSQELRSRLFTEIARIEGQVKALADARRLEALQGLLKNSAKWNLGALVSGFLFLLIWRITIQRITAEEQKTLAEMEELLEEEGGLGLGFSRKG
ncbi:HpsJ-like protein, cyanoexosortase A-associated [Anthocerotibacter panamensis]|uniref:HpsJ-like protein, cyanoexosortase A-associated n=1 Tax=Anthocerotibacter panamensis TaxID=2857077 RepID=UPI001C40233F|nr:HpsJ family protein [Anthocerotibacter panamensis]